MWFCPLDGSLLQIFTTPTNHFACPTCPYSQPIIQPQISKSYPTRKKVDDILGGEKAWENVDRTMSVCPGCSYGEAYFMQMQIRSADEPMSVFYKCVKCSHQWNDKWASLLVIMKSGLLLLMIIGRTVAEIYWCENTCQTNDCNGSIHVLTLDYNSCSTTTTCCAWMMVIQYNDYKLILLSITVMREQELGWIHVLSYSQSHHVKPMSFVLQ